VKQPKSPRSRSGFGNRTGGCEARLTLQYVSMHSHLAPAQRRIPTQRRGERRVAQLLKAAAAVIAAVGYDAATMSAIAERADAPIGSLYQFFPNKQAITQALRTEIGRDYEARLTALEGEAKRLSLDGLVPRLIDLSVDFVESHPAFLALLDAPSATRSPLSLRKTLRERLAACFRAVDPRVPKAAAVRLAAVTLQVLKGLNQLYAEAPRAAGRQYVREYKIALACYLRARLRENGRGAA